MKFIYPFVAPKLDKQDAILLQQQLFQENLKRCKLFAKVVILFEIMLILMNISVEATLNFYLIMYLLLTFMSIVMLLHINRLEKNTATKTAVNNPILFSLVVFFLVWGAVITLYDQFGYGHIMAFAVNFMCVSILYHADNKAILGLYVLPIVVILIGLPFFQASKEVLMGHYINLMVFLFFCWLASRMLYTSYVSNFYHERLLLKTNKENEKINQELEDANSLLFELSNVDELTKVPNRRAFWRFIENGLSIRNIPRKLSLFVLDIDEFKQYNDTLGHLEGDRVLKEVAQELHTFIKNDSPNGMIARFGGEEFILAYFDIQVDEITTAERIRKKIEDLALPHPASTVASTVTVSIGGVTCSLEQIEEVNGYLTQADEALYQAKQKGRNCVEIF
ncbi:GGDEF domain-containing protein [Sutcliffiella rhizosphaerae]|uniref:GGDEF domain-containing protein n=1 Tax=Sutcliffiella rhizosphaerae TaxID=2880967 RepID=A0ABM8YUB3_9BACI|nr:GGDEF domain-containing protein [Sutcliffiella rhizosphaerae]CAG9623565.1 hypothetical protein BACCIP111883_04383 [Sutcliffiella rhizosphaerae]